MVSVGWHHQLNEHEFEQTLGDSEGQEAWCATVHGIAKELDMTEQPYSQKTSQYNHTRTTALSNSMKLGHAHGAIPWGGPWWRDLTECGPLEKGMANRFSILALRTP